MTGYTNSGQYVMERLTLSVKDSVDADINLLPALIEANLFESIKNPCMSGSVMIVDTVNLSDILPLYGNEKVHMIFYTAGNEQNPVEYIGTVYKISERHRISEHTMGYTIMFCSEPSIKSERVFVNKGYSNNINKIVSDIYNKHLAVRPAKPCVVEDTVGIVNCTLGNVHPIEAILQLTKDSVSKQNNYGFVFYEDTKQFNYVSLQTLYQQDPIADYSYRAAGFYEDVSQRAAEQFNSIQEIKIFEENSFLDRIMDGQHGSHHLYFDLVNKKIDDIYYTKSNEFDRKKSLGTKADKKDLDSGDDIIFLKYGEHTEFKNTTNTQNEMKRIESETLKVNITVFGDSMIRVGLAVNATVPNWNSDQLNIKSSMSGKFLIGDIRHTFTQTQYAQSIMLYKDSYEEAV